MSAVGEWADYWYTDCDCACHDGDAAHTGPCKCFRMRDKPKHAEGCMTYTDGHCSCGIWKAVYRCQHCEVPFDPISTRWLCPWCHTKNTCCE